MQAWVALPEALERSAPRFQLAQPGELPVVPRGEVTLRVLSGVAFGARSPIETSSPVLLVEARTGSRAGGFVFEASPGGRVIASSAERLERALRELP